jgi:hypothetical protein
MSELEIVNNILKDILKDILENIKGEKYEILAQVDKII